MYRRSPILRAALSPSNRENSSQATSTQAKQLHRSIESKIAQMRVPEDFEKSLNEEVVDTQIVVSEFIVLFDKYRESMEARICELEAMEDRLLRRFERRLDEAKEEIRIETFSKVRDELHSLDSLGYLDVAVNNCLSRQRSMLSGRIQSVRGPPI